MSDKENLQDTTFYLSALPDKKLRIEFAFKLALKDLFGKKVVNDLADIIVEEKGDGGFLLKAGFKSSASRKFVELKKSEILKKIRNTSALDKEEIIEIEIISAGK